MEVNNARCLDGKFAALEHLIEHVRVDVYIQIVGLGNPIVCTSLVHDGSESNCFVEFWILPWSHFVLNITRIEHI